jgi:two-component system, cell cycle sensor histidine kinase and response regulator CckA
VISSEGLVSTCNQKFLDMWQIPRMEVAGLRDEELLSIAMPQLQDPEGFLRNVRSLYENPTSVSLDVLTLKDGRIFERYSQPETIGEQIVGRVWSFRDVTHTRRLEEELRQSQKMEAVGRLSGGVAHDFNNLLMLISGYANQILEDKNLPQQHRESGEQLLEATRRAAAFTRQLLAFSRKSPVLPVVIDLSQVVSDMQKLLKRLFSEKIQLVVHLSSETLPVYADPWQIELMIMNLAINARDAMPDGGVLSMTTSRETASRNEGEGKPPVPSDFALLVVADTGYGMSEEIKRHLFEPFFTTKDVGKGTGLGLSTVYGIVEQAGGYITVESEPNEGATFRVFLPRAMASSVEKARAQEQPPASGHETILLVEDESGIRVMTRGYLESLGYKVLEATSGRAAMQVSRLYQGTIDLLVTDLAMPEMRGDELVRTIRQERPGIAAIIISGQPVVEELEAHLSLVQKPFAFSELGRRVRLVLDEARQGRKKKQERRHRRRPA